MQKNADPENLLIPDDAEDIPGYEGLYCADPRGEIYSYDRVYPRKTIKAKKKIKTSRSDGRESVSLTNHSGQQNTYLVHRVIALVFLGYPLDQKEFDVDHKDGDPRNNNSSNLRLVTRSQNLANRTKPLSNTSGFVGVYAAGQRWSAMIRKGKLHYLGAFSSKEAAARAYDEAAREHYGVHATLNFPNPGEQSAHR
jgi:hypothetical protein